jgi:hypothetical protein
MVKNHTRKQKKRVIEPGPYQCHPRVGKVRPAHGCIPVGVLKEVAGKLGIQSSKNLRPAIEKQLGVSPNAERTFVNALPIDEGKKKQLLDTYLRPPQPEAWKSDPDKWLDSNDIESVMKQYEDAFPDFEFMGPYPIDFAAPDPYITRVGGGKKCLINEVCELRVQEALKNGTKYIGIIYNLDPHFKSGSHWVASFLDIPKHRAYYFDSYGMYPPKQIATFMKWLTTQDPRIKLQYNGRRFQHSNTECGMYSLYFVIRMLAGDNFRAFTRQSPPDSEMLKLRHWIFST